MKVRPLLAESPGLTDGAQTGAKQIASVSGELENQTLSRCHDLRSSRAVLRMASFPIDFFNSSVTQSSLGRNQNRPFFGSHFDFQ